MAMVSTADEARKAAFGSGRCPLAAPAVEELATAAWVSDPDSKVGGLAMSLAEMDRMYVPFDRTRPIFQLTGHWAPPPQSAGLGISSSFLPNKLGRLAMLLERPRSKTIWGVLHSNVPAPET